MPTEIPILYTGLNAAKPNWNMFFSNYNQRVSSARARQQQQKQFDALEQSKLRREFISSINIDDINSTNELLLSKKYEITKGVEDYMTQVLADSKYQIDEKDILQIKLLTNRANQEIGKINGWAKNQAADIELVRQHPEWFDKEKVNAKIIKWNPDKDGAYSKSKAEEVFIDMPIGQVIEEIRGDVENPNTASIISEIGGYKINSEAEWNSIYENRDPVTAEFISNNNAPQIAFIATSSHKGDNAFLKQRSIDKAWNSIKDPVTKESYENKAVKAGYDAEYGKYLYLRDQGKMFGEERDPFVSSKKTPKTEPTGKDKRTAIDITSGDGQFGDKSVISGGTKEYFDAEGKKQKKTFKRGAIAYTGIEWSENPETKKNEWMVLGYAPKKGDSIDLPKGASTEDLINAMLAASLNKGGSSEVEEIKIPYNSIKEEMDRNYRFEGMDTYKEPVKKKLY